MSSAYPVRTTPFDLAWAAVSRCGRYFEWAVCGGSPEVRGWLVWSWTQDCRSNHWS